MILSSFIFFIAALDLHCSLTSKSHSENRHKNVLLSILHGLFQGIFVKVCDQINFMHSLYSFFDMDMASLSCVTNHTDICLCWCYDKKYNNAVYNCCPSSLSVKNKEKPKRKKGNQIIISRQPLKIWNHLDDKTNQL